MTRRVLFNVFAAILTVFCLSSCDKSRIYDSYLRIPEEGWNADSLKVFSFSVGNSAQEHNVIFNVRNDRSYGFSNLWLFVEIISPSGEMVTDTIQVMLADPSGRWLGRGLAGIYQNRIVYRRQVYFPESGTYSVRLRHGMRPRELNGITDIGVRIEKSGS